MKLRRVLTLAIILLLGLASSALGKDGERLTHDGLQDLLAQAKGNIVVVNYWASWCGPCLTEMPMLKAMRAAYPSHELTLFGVSFDYDSKAHDRARERLSLTFPSYLAQEDLMHTLGITSVPRTDFYDSRRRLVRSHEGLISPAEFRTIVAEITSGEQ
ncbi:TlpA family protein disulfide reductase [Desulfocurvibacter africanus]|uniref:TlpA family protein disulfide reductase n=1 Tax=Desulfocurvibacter africanus TaxID=873 RepID=UPI0003FADE42|nr:TlpA disulfide reductase family protein [Desulfocurvibacter africanus]